MLERSPDVIDLHRHLPPLHGVGTISNFFFSLILNKPRVGQDLGHPASTQGRFAGLWPTAKINHPPNIWVPESLLQSPLLPSIPTPSRRIIPLLLFRDTEVDLIRNPKIPVSGKS